MIDSCSGWGVHRSDLAGVVACPSPGIAAFLRTSVRPGMTVLDIGANVGTITALAADLVGVTGHVIAIEPAPDNVECLLRLRACRPQITVSQAAAAERDGSAALYLDASNPTLHSLAPGSVARRGPTIAVPTRTLRAWLPADLIKVDAQGAEARIVRGAAAALAACRPVLILELWPAGLRQHGDDPLALVGQLRALGYDVVRLSAKGKGKPAFDLAAFAATASRWRSINVLAVPS